MKIYFVVLIGLPASGKTTLCSHLVPCFTSEEGVCVHVEYDKFVQEITDFKKSRSLLLENLTKAVECICVGSTNHEFLSNLSEVGNSPLNEVVFLLDDNMYYRSMRYEVYKLARMVCCPPERLVHYSQIYLKTSLEECVAHNSSRSEATRVPEEIIRNMFDKLEEPDESFWEASTFLVKTCTDSQKLAELIGFVRNSEPVVSFQMLVAAAKTVENDREKAREETLACTKHQCELAIRNAISLYLNRSDLSAEEKRRRSSLLQEIKKNTMAEVKHTSFLSMNDAKQFALSLFSSHLAQSIEN